MKQPTGTTRDEIRAEATPLESFEAFCCLQVERIERNLHRRYGKDYCRGNRNWLLPQNGHDTALSIHRDCKVETRGHISGFRGSR